MNRKHLWATVAVLAVGGLVAKADTLASPNGNPENDTTNPSWYNGSGNPQGGFTVDNNSGVEIGLRAKYRQNASVIDPTSVGGKATYVVVSGSETHATSGNPSAGGVDPARAAWNYEFSIDLEAGGPAGTNSHLHLADIANSTLKIEDLNTLSTITLNPLTSFGDDSVYGPAGKHDLSLGTTAGNADGNAHFASDWGAQNSENGTFTGVMPVGYNFNNAHTYEFTLDVINSAGATLAEDTIDVQVVAPLPSSATAGLALIAGLGIAAAVKRSRRVA